jgi:hypothetical protein
MADTLPVVVARIEQRVIALEHDIRDMKSRRPSWPSVVSALVAAAALIITVLNL